jgi:hypothetical protein
MVLAHWAGDVVAGFAVGMALESFLRCWAGFPVEPAQEAAHVDPDWKDHVVAAIPSKYGSKAL